MITYNTTLKVAFIGRQNFQLIEDFNYVFKQPPEKSQLWYGWSSFCLPFFGQFCTLFYRISYDQQ